MSLSCVRMPLQPAAGSWMSIWKLLSHGSGVLVRWLIGCSRLSAMGAVESLPVLIASRCGDILGKEFNV